MWFRSSYEYRIMNCLDNDENIIHYKYEPFFIEYGDKLIYRYIPDFLVFDKEGNKYIIETKSKYKMETEEKTKQKTLAGKFFVMKII